MNVKQLLEGLKDNFHVALHPTEQAQKDLMRCIFKEGYSADQLQRLYDELLRICQYFPRPYDVSVAASNLSLVSADSDQVKATKELLKSYEGHGGGCTFREWLDGGGMEEIRRDCRYDPEKIRKRLVAMGMVVHASEERVEPQRMLPAISDFDDSETACGAPGGETGERDRSLMRLSSDSVADTFGVPPGLEVEYVDEGDYLVPDSEL